jgi:hypothetical protein
LAPVLNIHLSARNVVKLDVGSQSDPMCVMWIMVNGGWINFGHTEVVWNNPNPAWVRFFQAAYIFETEQRLRFTVADVDSERDDISDHDIVGTCETTVQDLVSRRGSEVALELRKPRHSGSRGTLHVNVEQSAASASFLEGVVQAQDLRKVHTFSRNWPFFMLQKPAESGADLPVYRSETLSKCYGGSWKPFTVPLGVICGEDYAVPMRVSFYDQKGAKQPTLIASFAQSLQSFLEQQGQALVMQSGKKKGGAAAL